MAEYRVYKLNPARQIVAGEWIVADDDAEAIAYAQTTCAPGAPFAEVWQRHRKVAVVTGDAYEAVRND